MPSATTPGASQVRYDVATPFCSAPQPLAAPAGSDDGRARVGIDHLAVATDDDPSDGPHRSDDEPRLERVEAETAEQPASQPRRQQLERVAERCPARQPDDAEDRDDGEQQGHSAVTAESVKPPGISEPS